MSTSIEWTDETWNPLVGCSRTSPGCDHCYAMGVAHRNLTPDHRGLTVRAEGGGVDWTGEVRFVERRLLDPLRWRKPKRVFVNSMSDLFHPDVEVEHIVAIFAVMGLAEGHQFQVLTKRPQGMVRLLNSPGFWDDVRYRAGEIASSLDWDMVPHHLQFSADLTFLPNVWLGTSIESQQYAFRARHLLATPAAVHFVSAEPLLGPLDLSPYLLDPSLRDPTCRGVDWVIVGGESGQSARPMHPAWAEELRDQCRRAGVAFLFKQWGEWSPFAPIRDGRFDFRNRYVLADDGTLYRGPDLAYPDGPRRGEAVRAGHDHARLTSMYRVGKKAAGRELDGRTYDEYPA